MIASSTKDNEVLKRLHILKKYSSIHPNETLKALNGLNICLLPIDYDTIR